MAREPTAMVWFFDSAYDTISASSVQGMGMAEEGKWKVELSSIILGDEARSGTIERRVTLKAKLWGPQPRLLHPSSQTPYQRRNIALSACCDAPARQSRGVC